MPIWRLQCSWLATTAFPRDKMMINPHFDSAGVPEAGSTPDELCEDLATALVSWGDAGQVEVKAYDAQGTPPVIPAGSAIRQEGVIRTVTVPREVALCLSYYSEQNQPRRRGRLYLPAGVFAGTVALKPTLAQQQKVGALAQIFADLGGLDVDWCVYSRVDDDARPVSNWWVDNEWDTIRSRGLRADNRHTGTVGEAS